MTDIVDIAEKEIDIFEHKSGAFSNALALSQA